jgi:hypothetical protein
MQRTDREAGRYFETGLLIMAVTGLGLVAYWGLM